MNVGDQIFQLASELFPICRSISGDGVRETLKILSSHIPLSCFEVPTGEKVFDWNVPKEWNIKDAYIIDPSGKKIVDFKNNNLHVMSYSVPVNLIISKNELEKHLYSLPNIPEAIPYVTSYYREDWGFCLKHSLRSQLVEGNYKVFIDSELKDGALSYGELFIQGKSDKEILVSTYICHPSMGNNEVSGPALATFLAKWVMTSERKYSYRFVFVPEIIGSLCFIKTRLNELKKNTIAGFNLTCVGGLQEYSFLPSRTGDTIADRVSKLILNEIDPTYKTYSFLERGSDERNYCSPLLDLPVVSIMRSKYGTYKEYHTSLDNLDFIAPKYFQGSYDVHTKCFELIENNSIYMSNTIGEPQLGRRGLYPTNSSETTASAVMDILNLLAYCDGKRDVIELATFLNIKSETVIHLLDRFCEQNLITKIS
jgi:aminopeptidase-like protein